MKPSKPQYVLTASIPERIASVVDERVKSLAVTRSKYVANLIEEDLRTSGYLLEGTHEYENP